MADVKNEPLAFACAAENGHQPGMLLRDYFAGQVIVGLLARGADDLAEPLAMGLDMEAYRIADAMIAAREAK